MGDSRGGVIYSGAFIGERIGEMARGSRRCSFVIQLCRCVDVFDCFCGSIFKYTLKIAEGPRSTQRTKTIECNICNFEIAFYSPPPHTHNETTITAARRRAAPLDLFRCVCEGYGTQSRSRAYVHSIVVVLVSDERFL